MLAELLEPRDERFPALVEVLVDVLQPFRRHRLHADQRPPYARAPHGVEELGIFRRFHRDLREEDGVVGHLLERGHHFETLGANRLELFEMRRVLPPRGHAEVFERHRVEVVVGEDDEAEPFAPQRHHFLEHPIDRALPRALPVGAPHRTERAVLGAPAHRLHRRHHVLAFGHQVPARRHEGVPFDAPSVITRAKRSRKTVLHRLRPRIIAIPRDDGVRRAELLGLLGKKRRVNAAEHDGGTRGPGGVPYLVAAPGVARVDADPDDVAGADGRGVERLERLIHDDRVAALGWGGGGENVKPAWGNYAGAEGNVAGID